MSVLAGDFSADFTDKRVEILFRNDEVETARPLFREGINIGSEDKSG